MQIIYWDLKWFIQIIFKKNKMLKYNKCIYFNGTSCLFCENISLFDQQRGLSCFRLLVVIVCACLYTMMCVWMCTYISIKHVSFPFRMWNYLFVSLLNAHKCILENKWRHCDLSLKLWKENEQRRKHGFCRRRTQTFSFTILILNSKFIWFSFHST